MASKARKSSDEEKIELVGDGTSYGSTQTLIRDDHEGDSDGDEVSGYCTPGNP